MTVHWCWGQPSGVGFVYGWVVSIPGRKQFLIGFVNNKEPK